MMSQKRHADDAREPTVFSPLVEHAIELAAQWHDQTYRKGRWRDEPFESPDEVLQVPVMAHLTTVALTVQRAGLDDATVAAAFLHDIIEDANKFSQEFRYEELRLLMGEVVANRVLEVTEQKYDEAGNPRLWKDRKVRYIDHLRTASPEAVAISLADKLHNLWSINEALAQGSDVFATAPGRRALSGGPAEQRWFYRAVLEATAPHDDPRLAPLRARLEVEYDRFEHLTTEAQA
jgi:(p)ppGpp synthase/HD superfamily hydrolase